MDPCDFPWYKSYTAGCAGIGGLTGLLVGASLGAIGGGALYAGALGGVATVVAALIAFCACRLSSGRLRQIQGQPKSVGGIVTDVGRASMAFPFGDGDYLFNIKCVNRSMLDTKDDGGPACVRTKADGTEYMHCEITSQVTAFGCAGAITGAAAATYVAVPAGVATGGSILAASPGCSAFGPFFWLCLLVLLIAAVIASFLVSTAITGAGALLGGLAGGGIGAAADDALDQVGDAGADALKPGDTVIFTGDWVTDADHNWNEIHEIHGVMVIDRDIKDCAQALRWIGGVSSGLKTHQIK